MNDAELEIAARHVEWKVEEGGEKRLPSDAALVLQCLTLPPCTHSPPFSALLCAQGG